MRKRQHEEPVPVVQTELERATVAVLGAALTQEQQAAQTYVQLAQMDEARSVAPEFADSVKAQVASLQRSTANLREAYTKTSVLADELGTRLHDVSRRQGKRLLRGATPSNTQIDYAEERGNYFAKGNNIYKLLLVLGISSFVGVLIETLWCFLCNGYVESRAGLVYGPFNLVYGLGGVALTGTLYRYRNRGAWLSFAGGFLAGSGIEYLCSFVQEKVFGSTSWDYSAVPLNINGRICLLYSVFWGILGVWWIKEAYPFIAKWLLRIPNRVGKAVTVALAAFLVLDAAVSAAAVFRWSRRQQGVPAANAVERCLDARFPDRRMERIFPNLVFS